MFSTVAVSATVAIVPFLQLLQAALYICLSLSCFLSLYVALLVFSWPAKPVRVLVKPSQLFTQLLTDGDIMTLNQLTHIPFGSSEMPASDCPATLW